MATARILVKRLSPAELQEAITALHELITAKLTAANENGQGVEVTVENGAREVAEALSNSMMTLHQRTGAFTLTIRIDPLPDDELDAAFLKAASK